MKQIEIYLHVGMGKTGTSAIQEFLAEKASVLQEFGILYPLAHRSMDDGGAHHSLPVSMMRPRPSWAPVDTGASPEQILTEMHREAVALGLSTIVVSSEILYVIPPQAVRDLVKRFRSKIILYVRRQDLHVMSMTNQAIKAQGDYCDSATVSCAPMAWDELLRYVVGWMEAFPNTDVIVRPYERQQFVSGSLIADFLSILGVPLCDDLPEKDRETNQSLGRDALEYMNQVNAVVNDASFTGRIGDLLVGFEQADRTRDERRDALLSPSERLTVIARYAEMNARIATEFLGRNDGRLFHEPLPRVNDDWRPYPGLSRERAVAITAYLQRQNSVIFDRLVARLATPRTHVGMAAEQAMAVLLPAIDEVCGRQAA